MKNPKNFIIFRVLHKKILVPIFCISACAQIFKICYLKNAIKCGIYKEISDFGIFLLLKILLTLT